MDSRRRARALRWVERILLSLACLLLSVYFAARIDSAFASHAELRRFWEAQKAAVKSTSVNTSPHKGEDPDFRLWSQKRIAAYRTSLSSALPTARAVLKIPAINLEVPVLEGTDDLTLNRAVGHIEGTSPPGEDGNVGIAGHRDGFFRGLKDIHPGNAIDLVTQDGSTHYVVDEVVITVPEDVTVLRPRSKPSLTLVTCYPFYFVGSAPQRYIVHASADNAFTLKKSAQSAVSEGNEGAGRKATVSLSSSATTQ